MHVTLLTHGRITEPLACGYSSNSTASNGFLNIVGTEAVSLPFFFFLSFFLSCSLGGVSSLGSGEAPSADERAPEAAPRPPGASAVVPPPVLVAAASSPCARRECASRPLSPPFAPRTPCGGAALDQAGASSVETAKQTRYSSTPDLGCCRCIHRFGGCRC
jgi:hypothetical protein